MHRDRARLKVDTVAASVAPRRWMLRAMCGIAGLFALAWSATPANAQQHRYVGSIVQEFHAAPDTPLILPTDVAVDAAGLVYVADGVNNRIVVFLPDGTFASEITEVGDTPLGRPMSVAIDADGRLWITDTDHDRVVVRAADGALARIIAIPEAIAATPDLTDAVPGAGGTIWLADNDNQRILRLNDADGTWSVIGRRGESLGEFQYPFMLAPLPGGDIAITDVINGRVQVLNAEGVPAASLGSYGVELGQFYRPNGVTTDAEHNVWVSDGRMKAIQAFTNDGRLIDALRDEQGTPLRFSLPMGMAFDSDGALYVTDASANSVKKVMIVTDPKAPPALAAVLRQGETGPQAKSCTVCHLEWMQPLVSGRPTEMMPVPDNPTEYPAVSRPETCLSCHDGAVGDSRRRVWVEHGHRIGVVPPEGMAVPPDLPLANGRLACRTCHSAHSFSKARTTLEEIVFLRVTGDPGDLCLKCHSDFSMGIGAGMHPLGPMPVDMPEKLVHQHSHDTGRQVSCLTCHTGHGATHEKLLVLNAEDNDLCLACHAELSPVLFAEDARLAHAKAPALNDDQRAFVKALGTAHGENEHLLCINCHVPHRAPFPQHLLAFEADDAESCAKCHADQRSVIATVHDLTPPPPEPETNEEPAEPAPPETITACRSCHSAHGFTVGGEPTPLDPKGHCTACHQPDGLAASKQLGSVNHPQAECRACHNPHNNANGHFLQDKPARLCTSCHEQESHVVGGMHDVSRKSVDWPAESRNEELCLACHTPHGTPETGLFRAGLAKTDGTLEGSCLACHASVRPDSDGPQALLHVHGKVDGTAHPELAGEMTPQARQAIKCQTCHNPHAGADSPPHLLRTAGGGTVQDNCITCHVSGVNIRMIGHARPSLEAAGFTGVGCEPCHSVHGQRVDVDTKLLWSGSLKPPAGVITETSVADRHCVACHYTGGPVAPPAIATHPHVDFFNPNPPDSPGYFPLFNEAGEVDPRGRISCRTCHLTHGRNDPAPIPEGMADADARELRAVQWHLRTFTPGNVCTTCHGFDALRRFMYFHDAARRSGPIDITP